MIKMARERGKFFKAIAALMIISFSLLLVCEIGQEMGLLKLGPSKEYWRVKMHYDKK